MTTVFARGPGAPVGSGTARPWDLVLETLHRAREFKDEPIPVVSQEDFDWLAEINSPKYTQEKLDPYHLEVGRTLSKISDLEKTLAPLNTYIMAPENQSAANLAVSPLNASVKIKMLSDLLPPTWENGKQLVRALNEIFQWRNKLAHNYLQHFQIVDGKVVEGVWIVVKDEKKLRPAIYEAISLEKLREESMKVTVVDMATKGTLFNYVFCFLNDMPFPPRIPLHMIITQWCGWTEAVDEWPEVMRLFPTPSA